MEDFKWVIKLEITNSVNDNVETEWFFAKTEGEKTTWIIQKNDEQNQWNRFTPGAVSTRYYSMMEYTPTSILNIDISDLKGMKLKDFITIIKQEVK